MNNDLLHIVLLNPEIPQNTGNIGRTCVGLGARLHLVGDIGFSLREKALKRAGLDYWPKLKWEQHPTWDQFLTTLPSGVQLSFFSTHGTVSFWEREFPPPVYLVFGSESYGLPRAFYDQYKSDLIRIPVRPAIRSLNLATAVGVAAYEVSRRMSHPIYNRSHALRK